MTAHIEDVLLYVVAQDAWPYVWGGESHAEGGYDCSGVVFAGCKDAGVPVPRTAFGQWEHCKKHGLLIPVDEGLRTRGAQLWIGDGTGRDRDAIVHTALSLGDGQHSVEARSTKDGIGTFGARGRFQYAGRIPGVDYTTVRAPLPPTPGVRRTIAKGATGPDVQYLQQRLMAHSKNDPRLALKVDGVFGPATDQRVRWFQQDVGLTRDGIVGPKTWAKLG